jgi:hypothetical protein
MALTAHERHDENMAKPVNIVGKMMMPATWSVASTVFERFESAAVVKHEPEIRRAKAKRHVAWCNKAVHEAPWVKGDTSSPGNGGLYVALELAEQAHQAHALPYEQGLSKMHLFDPRRFTWVYDESGEADDCVKLRDEQTGRLAIWLHWAG